MCLLVHWEMKEINEYPLVYDDVHRNIKFYYIYFGSIYV